MTCISHFFLERSESIGSLAKISQVVDPTCGVVKFFVQDASFHKILACSTVTPMVLPDQQSFNVVLVVEFYGCVRSAVFCGFGNVENDLFIFKIIRVNLTVVPTRRE